MIHYLWYLPVGLFGASVYLVLSNWAVRKQAFREYSASRILQSITGSGTTMGLGFLGVGVPGLIIGSLLSSSSGVTNLARLCRKTTRGLWSRVTLKGMLEAAHRYRKFPIYNTFAVFLNAVSVQLPIFVLSSQFGATETGWFGYCQKTVLLPTVLISSAMVPVFYSRAKQARLDGTLASLTSRMINGLAGVNAAFMVFLALFGQDVFSMIFGARWRQAGLYASLLTPWLLVNFVVTPLSTLPLVMERQGADLLWQIVLLAVRAAGLAVGVYYHSDLITLGAFALASAFFIILYLRWLLRLAGAAVLPVATRVAIETGIALVLLGGCRLLFWWSRGNVLLLLAVLAPSLAYLGWRSLQQLREAMKIKTLEKEAL